MAAYLPSFWALHRAGLHSGGRALTWFDLVVGGEAGETVLVIVLVRGGLGLGGLFRGTLLHRFFIRVGLGQRVGLRGRALALGLLCVVGLDVVLELGLGELVSPHLEPQPSPINKYKMADYFLLCVGLHSDFSTLGR